MDEDYISEKRLLTMDDEGFGTNYSANMNTVWEDRTTFGLSKGTKCSKCHHEISDSTHLTLLERKPYCHSCYVSAAGKMLNSPKKLRKLSRKSLEFLLRVMRVVCNAQD